jgi:hypothetical protein
MTHETRIEGSLPHDSQAAISVYSDYRDLHDEAVKIGLFGQDLEDAVCSSDTIFVNHRGESNDEIHIPLLVPADRLEWFNIDLLKRVYGSDKQFYYYTHPPLDDEQTSQAAEIILKDRLDDGAVIFFDEYDSAGSEQNANLFEHFGEQYVEEVLGGGDVQRKAITFAGPVDIVSGAEVKAAPSLFETYQAAVEKGEFRVDTQNGVALVDVVNDSDASRLWEIYKNPFDELGAEHPATTGFDETSFMEIMSDPEVIKVVNRVDGKISTLCILTQDFDHCPWFNKLYFQQHYPDYFNTNNVLIFPGIVSDENMRGNDYAAAVIDLLDEVIYKRGSNLLVTFECTETSATYVPKIVMAAVANNGLLKISGLEQSISETIYKAIRKIN